MVAASSTASRASRSASGTLPDAASARARTVRQITWAHDVLLDREPLADEAQLERLVGTALLLDGTGQQRRDQRELRAVAHRLEALEAVPQEALGASGVALEQRGLRLAVGRRRVDRLAHLVEQPVALLEHGA